MSLSDYNDLYKTFPQNTIILRFSDGTVISNDRIVEQSLELDEAICSDVNLQYGACESSKFSIKIVNESVSFKGLWVDVYVSTTNKEEYLITDDNKRIITSNGQLIKTVEKTVVKLGRFNVYSDKPTNDRKYRVLVCYDAMKDLINVDITQWYEGLTFPISLKNFRDSLFTFLGFEQETRTLINDSYMILGGFNASALSSREILTNLCELNGVFGHINRDGKFDYISLSTAESVTLAHYKNGGGTYEDYMTDKVTKVISYSSDNDVGVEVGTDGNSYVITNNLITYGDEGNPSQVTALTNLLNEIKDYTYRPFTIKTYGNPALDLGTKVIVNTTQLTINSFVMERHLTGVHGMKDSYRSLGDQVYPPVVNQTNTKISRLYGKTIKLQSELTETEAKTVLKLTADGRIVEAELKAAATGSSVKIKADNIDFIADDVITLSAKNIGIQATNFKIDKTTGLMECKGGSIGGFTIDTTKLYNGMTSLSDTTHDGVYVGTDGIALGKGKFKATSTGAVTASNITATGGKVGNYTIDNGALKSQSGNSKVELHPAYIYLEDASTNLNIQPNQIAGRGTNIVTTGTKNRLVETTDYGDRLLYCYETPTPMFGDIGEGTIAEDGKCYIWLDPVFAQTINNNGYQVFLQKYGKGECYVTERKSNYFVVEGDAGLSFGWELKAKQSDYEMRRLDAFIEQPSISNNYGNDAIEHIKEIQQEREVI